MADTMQFDLVAPERMLTSVAATAVTIPGSEGELTAMPGHAPLILTLRPGIVRVEGPKGAASFVVTGGFAEINTNAVSVLAEKAIPVTEVTSSVIDQLVSEAESLAASAPPEEKANSEKLIADTKALKELIRH
ncbi:ATP synthase F1 subunit epsilon [Haematobacter massiliensis]|uniref:ATP synthase epsilon chain n=1 Tax=Haematobacter massiliensis TaxID=195105 RepID=A0A086YB68_9RHOB|nr:F0F1 ATP synthase subunit epsilon [Haematobacter massiliensis]KFI31518.1 ATP synthase subunit epsilon [Haematobacter massiliensis]OWJ71590.1 ATP synthase F1 subunit epsilon [Haematobacter massiliensis]OWJ88027.1 ATP synthase F1 subunit epsilon [Haematobacter massiliensis]QBJ23592.1 F0F1 ATP synthase subunit epsilon [Haematobacter massiliensis]